jgi:hypothetical protein
MIEEPATLIEACSAKQASICALFGTAASWSRTIIIMTESVSAMIAFPEFLLLNRVANNYIRASDL